MLNYLFYTHFIQFRVTGKGSGQEFIARVQGRDSGQGFRARVWGKGSGQGFRERIQVENVSGGSKWKV